MQAIIGCRFFTLIAVIGSLVGSILCFVEVIFKKKKKSIHIERKLREWANRDVFGFDLILFQGCFLVLESYIEDFHIVSHSLNHGQMVHIVIEAIGM